MLTLEGLPVLIEDCTAAQRRKISRICNRAMRGDQSRAMNFAQIAGNRMANARVILMCMQVIDSKDRAAFNAAIADINGNLRPHMKALVDLELKLVRAQTVHEKLNDRLVKSVQNFNLYMLAGIKVEGDLRARGEQADLERLRFFAPRFQSLNQYAAQMESFLRYGDFQGKRIEEMRHWVGLMLTLIDRQLRRDDAPQP